MLNFKIKRTIIASLIWSAMVWAFGEGFGELVTGQSLLLTGAPSAVLLYGLVAISIFPKTEQPGISWQYGIRFAQISFTILCCLGAVLDFHSNYVMQGGLSHTITIPWLSRAIGDRSMIVTVTLGLIELSLGISYLFKLHVRFASGVSIILSLIFWWVGQSFGQVFTPLATDINSGPLMALLSICVYPRLVYCET